MAGFEVIVVIEDAGQAFHALVWVVTKVVGVPPEVIDFATLGGPGHFGLYSLYFKIVQKIFFGTVWAQ